MRKINFNDLFPGNNVYGVNIILKNNVYDVNTILKDILEKDNNKDVRMFDLDEELEELWHELNVFCYFNT